MNTNIQEWAEGLLDDQKPLEVLYEKHPDTGADIIIVKYYEKVALLHWVNGDMILSILVRLYESKLKELEEE